MKISNFQRISGNAHKTVGNDEAARRLTIKLINGMNTYQQRIHTYTYTIHDDTCGGGDSKNTENKLEPLNEIRTLFSLIFMIV